MRAAGESSAITSPARIRAIRAHSSASSKWCVVTKIVRPSSDSRRISFQKRRRATGEVYRWEFTEQGKDFELAVDGRLLVNDNDAMVRAALEGLGVAYLIESCIERELAERRLVRVLEAFCPPFPGFFLYYPSRQHLAPKLQALVDWLRVKRRR